MQSRRDQVQAHQFLVSRLTSGLLRADPDIAEPPTRRTNRGMAYGLVIGAVVSAGFLLFGLLSPGGNTSWKSGRSLIIEKGTGTRYVYDGNLRPIRNYPSARLLLGADMATESVSAGSLAGTPHGSPVGIPGAPDALPAADRLNAGAWQVCAAARTDDKGAREPVTVLGVDVGEQGTGVQGDQGILVSGPDGGTYLLWQDNRFRLTGGRTAAAALGYGGTNALPVSAAFLDSVPAGPDLVAPSVSGAGSAGPQLDGRQTRVGQVFVVQTPGAAQQYYLLGSDGLIRITTTQAALTLVSSDTRVKAYGGHTPTQLPLSAQALSGALSPQDSGAGTAVRQEGARLPSAPPKLVTVGDTDGACIRLTARGSSSLRLTLALVPVAAFETHAEPPGRAAAPACLAVDAIAVPPSGGSLVRALSSAGAGAGTAVYLVTDTGVKYRVTSAEAAKDLGYDLTEAQGLPASLLAMVPTGVDLSPEAAVAGRAAVTGVPPCEGERSRRPF
ncbi:type VII secretion protein EccB (plasmid) [Streptomyces sp. FXJ1.172]|uniref:type VII secretion protein EccB n=1 Tax=Streptomyces sp. FXJ1.172 TaxID=710705 RepID=UPI0023DD2BEF|nr:type VII secretion protein EccB [Streptomyces sp. FXJ1.172]WEP00901.1 type VII secretion protein EccB [Streptomyces sp. FXJ1.172]